jgi:hypothetical protein
VRLRFHRMPHGHLGQPRACPWGTGTAVAKWLWLLHLSQLLERGWSTEELSDKGTVGPCVRSPSHEQGETAFLDVRRAPGA